MPYITEEAKSRIDADMLFGGLNPQNPGELNYVITTIIRDYFRDPGRQNYQAINDIIGALEGAKLEFYRRVAAPYEDNKIYINGDVY